MTTQSPLSTPPAGVLPLYESPSPLSLHVIVIGCGLGGLAATHTISHALPNSHITLIEAASLIGDVGAGIQVSPNATRLLMRWGLGPALAATAVRPEAIVFRRYSTGEKVGYTRWGERMEVAHGAPYLHVHRADYHRLLTSLVDGRPNVKIRLASTVTSVEPDPDADGGPSVTLANGDVIHGDLIIGADGVKSIVQGVVTGRRDAPRATGDAAYRAVIPTDVMTKDPELKQFVETPEMTAWMAPRRHLMAYCIRAKKEFNLVLLHPDDGSVESWTAEGSADKMRRDFADFEPRVQKMLSFVTSTLKWRLMDRSALERWVHPKGRVALLGDSCHPMLPYRAQGAAMAIEDAAVLGALLAHLRSIDQLPVLLQAYEDLRLSRCSDTQQSSRFNQHVFHLPDGPEQEARDAAMRRAMDIELAALKPSPTLSTASLPPVGAQDGMKGNPNQWADQGKNRQQFSYDADEEVEKWWRSTGRKLLGSGEKL